MKTKKTTEGFDVVIKSVKLRRKISNFTDRELESCIKLQEIIEKRLKLNCNDTREMEEHMLLKSIWDESKK
jgi:hypothetical protein